MREMKRQIVTIEMTVRIPIYMDDPNDDPYDLVEKELDDLGVDVVDWEISDMDDDYGDWDDEY